MAGLGSIGLRWPRTAVEGQGFRGRPGVQGPARGPGGPARGSGAGQGSRVAGQGFRGRPGVQGGRPGVQGPAASPPEVPTYLHQFSSRV